jgi:hypothetical protein
MVRESRIYLGGFFAICAGYFHGVYLLVPFLLLLAAITTSKVNRWFLTLRTSIAMIAAVILLVLTSLIFDTKIVPGDANGGGDGRILPSSILSFEHLRQTVVLLMFGSFLILYQFRFGYSIKQKTRNFLAPAIFFGFLFLWNFDLGWRQDMDLIIASSVVLLWSRNHESLYETQKIRKRDLLLLAVLVANMSLLLSEVEWIFI